MSVCRQDYWKSSVMNFRYFSFLISLKRVASGKVAVDCSSGMTEIRHRTGDSLESIWFSNWTFLDIREDFSASLQKIYGMKMSAGLYRKHGKHLSCRSLQHSVPQTLYRWWRGRSLNLYLLKGYYRIPGAVRHRKCRPAPDIEKRIVW